MLQSNIPTAWGLDIGEKSLKMAAVAPASGKFVLTNIGSVAFDDEEIAKNIVQNPTLLGKKIRELTAHHTQGKKIKSEFVHACIPDSDTFVKLIDIPDMTDEEIPEAVRWASEQHIPLSPDDMYLDWHVVRHDPQNKKIYVLVGAVQKDISNRLTEAIKAADLVPLSLDVEATAIVRALRSFAQKNKKAKDAATAFLDFGATHSTIIIYAHGTIQFVSTIPFSGDAITEKLSQELHITRPEAEKAKIVCGLTNPDCEDALKTILKNDLDTMIEKIQSSFTYYKEHTEAALPIEQLILCGGGSTLGGMNDYLDSQLSCTVTAGHVINNSITTSFTELTHNDLSYTTALGLAMKAYE